MPLFFIYLSMTSLVYHSKQVFTTVISSEKQARLLSLCSEKVELHSSRIIHSSTSWFIPHSMDGHNALKVDGSPSNTSECSYDSAVSCPQQNLRAVHLWSHWLTPLLGKARTSAILNWVSNRSALHSAI